MIPLVVIALGIATLGAAAPSSAAINCVANPFQPACCPAPSPVGDAARIAHELLVAANEQTKKGRLNKSVEALGAVQTFIGTGNPAPTAVLLGVPPHIANDPLVQGAWRIAATSTDAASARDSVVALVVSEALSRLQRFGSINSKIASNVPTWVTTVAAAAPSVLWGQMDTARRVELITTTAIVVASDVRAQGLARSAASASPPPTSSPSGSPLQQPAAPTPAADLVGTIKLLGDELARQIDRNNLRAANVQNAQRLANLRETVQSYEAAVQYERTRSTLLQGQIALAFADPARGAEAAKQFLRDSDHTAYDDSWTKGPAAAAAGAALYDIMANSPDRLSPPSGLSFCSDSSDDQNRGGQSCRDRLLDASANWLEAAKYLDWLRPFRDAAIAADASLTARIQGANGANGGVLSLTDAAHVQLDDANRLLAQIASAIGRFGRLPKLVEFQRVASSLAAQASVPSLIAYAP